jgi:hypothetical protein
MEPRLHIRSHRRDVPKRRLPEVLPQSKLVHSASGARSVRRLFSIADVSS